MGLLDNIDITLPDGAVTTVSELDDYMRETRVALKTAGLQEHDGDGHHKIPNGTTAERNSVSSPPDGMLWINITTGTLDWYDSASSAWTSAFTGVGSGDMLAATYDGDGDGVVESADQITDGGANTVTAAEARAHIDSVLNPHSTESTQVNLTSFAAGVYQLDEMVDGSFVVDVKLRQMFSKLALLHNRRMPV